MNYTVIKPLPSLEEIRQLFPLSDKARLDISRHREEVKNILTGKDPRLLMIIGPCSAWPKNAVLHYAEKLANLHEKIQHTVKLVMRVYTHKPRTRIGWSGPLNQPDPCSSPDIAAGMKYTREMMIQVTEMGLPIADEALSISNAKGFLELLTWVAIGARSTENQEHRIFASMIDCPVGLKNPTHGCLNASVNSVIAAQNSHITMFEGHEIQTFGNPYAHLVLRGSHNKRNCSINDLIQVKNNMDVHDIKNPAVIIDVSHDNSVFNGKKDHRLQPKTIEDLIEQLKKHPDLKSLIKGFMVESFLKEGHQSISDTEKIDYQGLSLTDPCLSWEQTEEMLLRLG
jgi:3-deoxy-7-phosphoheptulonate synthase